MQGLVILEGVVSGLEEAKVPLWDRAVLQGDAVFEVLRTHQGLVRALDAHLGRLGRSCARVGLPDVGEALREDVARLLTALPEGGEWALRLWVGGRGAPGLARANTGARRAAIATRLQPYPESMYREGVAVVTQVGGGPALRTAGAKTTNYLSAIVATTAAHGQGAHEVVTLGSAGQVIEGASSNVFAWTGGRLRTPSLSSGALAGITRDTVLSLAKVLGIPVAEAVTTVHDLYRADEVFLTSTIRGPMPVVRVDGQSVGGGAPGPVFASLADAFAEHHGTTVA